MGAGTRLYVGRSGGAATVFRSATVPTEASHGYRFAAVIGPFRTKAGADLMARYGRGNPHLRSVSDAERLARRGTR